MKEFAAFVHKEFIHIFRDVRTVVILIVLPITLILLFGFALSVEIRNVKVGILAPQHEALTESLARNIDAGPYFSVTQQLHSVRQIDPLMRQGRVDVVVAFGSHFSKQLAAGDGAEVAIIVDGSNPNIATSEVMYLSSIVQRFLAGGEGSAASPGITPDIKLLYNPQLRSSYNFVPGVMGLILILVCALMTSVSIVREKEQGSMEVLLVSPVKPLVIIIAKMVPYFVISCVVLAIVLVMSVVLLGIPLSAGLLWVVPVSLVYIILGLAIGLLVSTMANSQMVASLLTAVVFMMPILMLSGMLFPIESMPKIFQWLSYVVPARWYISAVRKLMIEGLGVQYVVVELSALLAMTAAVMTLALKKFNIRLE